MNSYPDSILSLSSVCDISDTKAHLAAVTSTRREGTPKIRRKSYCIQFFFTFSGHKCTRQTAKEIFDEQVRPAIEESDGGGGGATSTSILLNAPFQNITDDQVESMKKVVSYGTLTILFSADNKIEAIIKNTKMRKTL